MPYSAWEPMGLQPMEAYGEEPAGISGYTSFDAPYSSQGREDVPSYADGAGLGSWAAQPSPAELRAGASAGNSYRVGSTGTRGSVAASARSGEAPLRMEVGATVRIKGLRSKPKLNGQDGSLVECDTAGRWSVLLADGDICKLQEKFLELRAPPAPPPPARERSPSPAAELPDPHLSGYIVPSPDAEVYDPQLSGYFVSSPDAEIEYPERFDHFAAEPQERRQEELARGPFDGAEGSARPSGTGRRKICWAKPPPSMFDQPPPPQATAESTPRTASSSSKDPGGAKVSAPKAKIKKKEAQLDNHLAALQAMMAQEEAKQELLLRQHEAPVVVPGVEQLLADLDKAEEAKPGDATRSGRPSRGSGSAMKMPSSAPRALNPDEAAVPDLGQLLAEIDEAEERTDAAPSIDEVLALLDKDEEADSARSAFLMLGSGVEPELAKPMDPLAKMIRLTGGINPMDLLPIKHGTPSREERKSEIAFVSRKAQWRQDEPRPPAPTVALALEDSLVGEGPLFGECAGQGRGAGGR